MARFSKRFDAFDFDAGPEPLAAALSQRKRHGQPVIDLTVSNPTKVGLDYPRDVLRKALAAAADAPYEPDPRGNVHAREAIADYYAARGVIAKPQDFLLTSGTSEGYAHLFALLCNPGDTVLAPAPGYPLFDFIAAYASVELAYYELDRPRPNDSHWSIEFEKLEAAVDDTTRAIIVVQPGNPTGSVLSEVECERLLAFAARHRLSIIVDEVFCDYCFDETRVNTLSSDSVPVFTLNGISKVLALPQLKLSWIRLDGPSAFVRDAAECLEVWTDTFLSVNTPVQLALPALMDERLAIQSNIHKRLKENLAILELKTAGSLLRFVRPQGGWYAILGLPGVDSAELALSLMETHGVYVHPGGMFGFAEGQQLVVSLLTPPNELEHGLDAITATVNPEGSKVS